ncbi:M4 family metallopeptidase [Chryseolinea lacunae]|uniref:M4 family metallopeptidase n=1 Tax=Chryseolinea lacunae TaxID=2801331 RepID=A0ABS1KZJ7_9BACT|nr:M4 family metallopeptidase [Chryseolinea lacunae]MBL0744698.1 M4 family metallopeptidase [Chryseolinea lacunae]
MNRILLFTFVGFLSIGQGLAQKTKSVTPASVGVANPGTGTVYYGNRNEPPRAMEFKKGTVSVATFLTNINTYFNIPAAFTFRETESNTDNLGMRHRLLAQYYNGLPVEGMGYRVHEKDGFVTSANGRAVRQVNVDTHVLLGEEQAFRLAAQYLQTKDTTVRAGKKLIVSKDFTLAPESFSIAYQFDIDVSLVERWRVSVDARDGTLINKVSLVNSCHIEEEKDEGPPPPYYSTGTGTSSYYGVRPIRIESTGYNWRLVGQTEHGGKIGTYDFRNASVIVLQLGIPFTPSDIYSSTKTFNDYYQRPGVSAHWSAEQTYEYYLNKHNRNSFDNNGGTITTYVHVDVGMDNAFWTGKVLALGDGSNNNPLVELDVIGHELTHGVTQYEAKLQYSYESGALNESFSDIMAKAIEFDTFGDTATWQMGKYFRANGLRDLSNPNLKNQPDTYSGDLWYTGAADYGGVHTNSGVQNFWFYLLSEGGSGVNDHQVSYSVNSIGIEAAAKIAYRNLTEYLGPQADYLDSRIGSLLATADLYGKNSTTYQEVDKAWDAVGVIDEPIITSLNVYDITATTVKLKGTLLPRGNTVTYRFEYGTTLAYGSTTASYTYSDKVEGILTGLQSKTKYYVKLVATNENGSSNATTEFTTISLAPLVKIKQTADVTETTASLYGEVNPNSLPTSFYFEYGLTPALGSVTPSSPLPAATEYQKVSASISSLQPHKMYYFRLVATNGSATTMSASLNFFTAVKPVITSYAPTVAQIGTEVIIAGLNFNAVAQKNIVNFGATRGTVLSASATQLKVKVPAGASLGPISVMDTDSGLSDESVQEFVPTFTGDFNKNNFQLRVGSTDYMYQTLVHDMDGDSKPDIVVLHYLGFSVFQNVNQGGDLTNESFVRNTYNSEYTPEPISLVDLDGNGLKDVVARYQGQLRVYPNLSVPGFIFFGTPVILPVGNFVDLTFNDFDEDGHPDIALTENLPLGDSVRIKIFRNQNPQGFILPENFVNQFSIRLPYYVYDLIGDDFDNDGKPDLLFGAYNRTFVPILKNNSRPGVLAFDENRVPDAITVNYPRYISQDLNQDGWKDVVSNNRDQVGTMTILENKRTSPVVTLRKTDFAFTGNRASIICPADVNGDGTVDLLTGTGNGKFVLLKNKGGNQAISQSSFEKFEEYGSVNEDIYTQSDMTINDLNGDGRPDVINTYSYNRFPHQGYQMEIWQNSATNNCLDPALVKVNVSTTMATVVLPPNTTRDQFTIEYSYDGNSNWYSVPENLMFNVNRGYDYQVRVRTKCYLGFTDYYYIKFTPECVDTSTFAIGTIGVDNVSIVSSNLSSFEVQYSVAAKNQWLSQFSNTIVNLLPGTTYDLRYRGQCAKPTEFKYKQFTTLCSTLASLTVTDIVYNRAVVRWTSNYSGNVILEYTPDNVTWTLIDVTQTLYPLIPGKQYNVRGRLTCSNTNSEFIYKSFSTPCPNVSALSVDAITPFGATVRWADGSGTGSYIVTYKSGGKVTTVETQSTSFILEDLQPGTQYTVAVAPKCIGAADFTSTTFNTICYVPVALSAEDITHTSAQLTWIDTFGSVPYSIDYSIAGTNVWVTAQTPSTTLSLTKLRPGTQYEVRVHITCTSQTAPDALLRFKTELYDETTFFPNPTDREITIHPSQDLIGHRYSIYDNVGRIVASGELLDYTIDMSNWTPGVYTLKIEDEKPLKIVKR